MGIVFINYRREQTAGEARALYNDLVQLLGAERVFMDVDNIALGRDFREVLHERLQDCEVMLALIGRGWADARDAGGQRRLDQPADFVRLEIATALQRNVSVTPVLLQDARMPAAETLPEDLKPLAFRNGFEIGHQTWESNVRELVRRLGLPAAPAASPTPAATPSRLPLLAGAAALVVAGGLGAWYATRPAPGPTPAPTPSPVPTPAPDAGSARALVAELVGTDKQLRQEAATRLQRDYLRSPDALRAAIAYLPWERFRLLAGAAPRAQLLGYLLASEDAAWSAQARAEAARGLASLREQIAAGEASFRPEIVERIEQLSKRVGG